MAIPISAITSGLPTILGTLNTRKDCPKTLAGKLFGGLSGRNKNCDPTIPKGSNVKIDRSTAQNSGVSGNLAFGRAQSRYNPLVILGVIAGAVLLFKNFVTPTRRRRR